jgi:hypothetical protein
MPRRLDHALFMRHLATARAATDPFVRFEAFWKAFNVYYECFYQRGQRNQEHDLISRAVVMIPPGLRGSVLSPANINPIIELEPIYDEKLWRRFEHEDRGKHLQAKRDLKEILQGAAPGPSHLNLLADVLYVVRCNMFHGFKSADQERDRAVVSGTLPALASLVAALPVARQSAA